MSTIPHTFLDKFEWIEETPKSYNLRHWLCIDDVVDHIGLRLKLTEESLHPYRNRFQFVKIDTGEIYLLDDFLKDSKSSKTYEIYMIHPNTYNKEKDTFL